LYIILGSAVCNSKVALVTLEEYIEKHKIFLFTVTGFWCLYIDKTSPRESGDHLIFFQGMAASMQEVTGQKRRAPGNCRQGRRFSSN